MKFKIVMLGVDEKDNINFGEYETLKEAGKRLIELKEKDWAHYYEIRKII